MQLHTKPRLQIRVENWIADLERHYSNNTISSPVNSLLKLILIQCPSGRSERKTIHMVAALCKVLIASRDNQRLSEEQKEKINNKTCDMVSTL